MGCKFRLIISAIILIGVLTSISASEEVPEKSKIALYVLTNDKHSHNVKKKVEAGILVPFVKSGKFIAIERNDVFLSRIEEERQKQASGSLENEQISKISKEAGAQVILVVVVYTTAEKAFKIRAYLMDSETSEIVGKGESEFRFKIAKAANDIFEQTVGYPFKSFESKKGYAEFSTLEKWGTFGLNLSSPVLGSIFAITAGEKWAYHGLYLFPPGVGSFYIMDDFPGGLVQVGLTSLGMMALMPFYYDGVSVSRRSDELILTLGIGLLIGGFIDNSIRSFTYKRRVYFKEAAYSEYEGFNVAVLPNRHGSFNAYLMYNKEF